MSPQSTPDEVARLRRIVESQNQALAHWRREADRDAGKIARYERVLQQIADLPKSTSEAHTAANRAIEIARETLP